MFSEADISKLVQSFLPATTGERNGVPVLVRSLSGNGLVKTQVALKKFEHILQTSTEPLAFSALPKLLGVQDVQWLLDENRSGLIIGKDGILPSKAQEAILKSFCDAVEQDFIVMDDFVADQKISSDALQKILDKHGEIQARVMNVSSSEDPPTSYTCSKNLWQKSKEDVFKAMIGAADTPVDLSSRFPRMPGALLHRISRELISDSGNEVRGEIERSSSGIKFTPEAAQLKQQNEKERERGDFINATTSSLHQQGFYVVSQTSSGAQDVEGISGTTLIEDVVVSYQTQYPQSGIVELRTLPNDTAGGSKVTPTALVESSLLESRQKQLAERAAQLVEEIWDNRALDSDLPEFSHSLDEKICTAGEYRDLDRCIFHSAGGDHLGTVFANAFEELRQDATEKANTLLQLRLLSPAALYGTGVEGIADSTLQPRIAEFVRDHLKETAPSVVAELKEQKVIASKAIFRDLEKFSQNITAARTLDEVKSALAKLVRKLKLSPPGSEVLAEAKRDVLRQKSKAMKKMKRGSDLLQNLVWILLASKREGLFMSSGKDTSRMVKLYQQTGGADEEVAKRLEGLRDAVKAGKETDEEKERMRDMAEACLV